MEESPRAAAEVDVAAVDAVVVVESPDKRVCPQGLVRPLLADRVHLAPQCDRVPRHHVAVTAENAKLAVHVAVARAATGKKIAIPILVLSDGI